MYGMYGLVGVWVCVGMQLLHILITVLRVDTVVAVVVVDDDDVVLLLLVLFVLVVVAWRHAASPVD